MYIGNVKCLAILRETAEMRIPHYRLKSINSHQHHTLVSIHVQTTKQRDKRGLML